MAGLVVAGLTTWQYEGTTAKKKHEHPISYLTGGGLLMEGQEARPTGLPSQRLLSVRHGQFRPSRQGGGAVVQEHDAAGLGKGQVAGQGSVIHPKLLQDLAIVRVVGIQPGALGGQTAAPPEREEAGILLAGGRQALLQLVEAPVQKTHAGPA